MAEKKNPVLFDDVDLVGTGFVSEGSERREPDPVAACLGAQGPQGGSGSKAKAGYYLPEELLQRFDETWLRLRLAREPVESKSRLVELALELLLADLEAGENSRVLRLLRG